MEEEPTGPSDGARRYRELLDNLPLPTFVYDMDTLLYLDVNEAAVEFYGYSRQEFLAMKVTDIRPPQDVPRLLSTFDRLNRAPRKLGIWRHRKKDGTGIEVEIFSQDASVGNRRARLVIARDVSEQQRLARAQLAFTRVADAANAASSLHDLLRGIHEIVAELMPAPNLYIALLDSAAGMLEFPYSVDEQGWIPAARPLGRGLTEYVLRTGRAVLLRDRAAFDELLARGEIDLLGNLPLSWLGVPLRTQERTVGVLGARIVSGPVRYGEREMELLQFVSTQVARAIERKQGEEALRASECRFRALIENSSDGIALISPEGAVVYRSPTASELLGYQRDEPVPPLLEHILPEDVPVIQRVLTEAQQRQGVPRGVVVQGRRKDGSIRTFEALYTNLVHDPAVRGIVINFRDVTDRKQMEGRLMMADRMVSVGTLAAGVAHEINNPLAYLIGNLAYVRELLEGRLPNPAEPELAREAADALREAHEGAERVRTIVRDLKTFSRADESAQGPVSLQQVLDASANMAWNEIRHRARLVKDYEPELPPVQGNESRLGQVFLNLLVNAAQAIGEGNADRNQIRITTRREGYRVVTKISDTGAGIPRDVRARLFDPFFTTKPVGVGTGLGLFICQNIIAALRGEITVESEVGRGTTFRVTLPISAAQPAGAPGPGAPGTGEVRPARILVLDDEAHIGSALRRTLAGHAVVSEEAAQDALQRLRAGERFDVILCDVMMPEMTGVEFHACAQQIAPDQAERIVFITGGAFTPGVRAGLDGLPNQRLEKPIDVPRLRAIIQERLRPRGAPAQ